MVEAAGGFATRGISTATFDFPYMASGRKIPRSHGRARAGVVSGDCRRAGRSSASSRSLLGASRWAAGWRRTSRPRNGQGEFAAVILLGYPLHPPGKPEQRRDAHLPDIAEPMLFVQGEKDTFGGTQAIDALLPRLQHATLHPIRGGDHSFRVPGGKANQEAIMTDVLTVAAQWIRSHAR